MNKKFSLYTFLLFMIPNLCYSQIFPDEGILITEDVGTNLLQLELINLDLDKELEIIARAAKKLIIYDQISPWKFQKSLPLGENFDSDFIHFEDFNNDGHLDILTFSQLNQNTLEIYFNNGNGQFVESANIDTGNNLISRFGIVIKSEKTEDYLLLSPLFNNNIIYVHKIERLSNSQFDFTFKFDSIQTEAPIILRYLDIDSDETNELVCASLFRQFDDVVFELNGTKFEFKNNIPKYSYLEDFNADNNIDILGIDANEWFPNLGNGQFNELEPIPLIDGIVGPSLTVADFNNDRFPDIIKFSNTDLAPLQIYLNNTSGNFENFQFTTFEHRVEFLKSADFNRNGNQDLIVVDRQAGQSNPSIILYTNISSFKSISGCSYLDENNNGIKDINEKPIGNISSSINASNNIYHANDNGCFAYFVEDGAYQVTFQPHPNWILSSSPSSYDINVNGNSFQDLDFGFVPRDTFLGGLMHAVSSITRCNSDVRFDFTFQNQGTTIITEGVIWVLQDVLTELVSTQNPIDSILADGSIGFKFENLYPGESITRTITLGVPGLGGDIEPGTLIEIFSATEATNTQGFTIFFEHNYSEEIRCAYDPNDKLISPLREEEENYTLFGDTLVYTVRFQNTGNDTAFNVIIRDTLDQNLDVSTFNILGSSHRAELSTDIQDGKNITFNFENILLPDSTIDFVGSQGYVTYSIQANDPIPENTAIENTASIFFDFNPPIVTNTTLNTMVSCFPVNEQVITATINDGEEYELPDGTIVNTAGIYDVVIEDEEGCPLEIFIVTLEVLTSTSSLELQNSISIAPNPVSNIFTLTVEENGILNYQGLITNPLGQKIKTIQINDKKTDVYANQLESGVYFLQILDKKGDLKGVKKFVVVE